MIYNIFHLLNILVLISTISCEVLEKNDTNLKFDVDIDTKFASENISQNSNGPDTNNTYQSLIGQEMRNETEDVKKIMRDSNEILSFGEYADKIKLEGKNSHPLNEMNQNSKPNENGTPHRTHIENDINSTVENSQKVDHKPKFRSNYNFASSTCGAHIINHSRRAKHTSEMLIDNPDTYSLFPCINNQSKPLWFIIQLCEPIRIHSIYLSNMELFSSHVKSFRMSVTNQELLPNDSQWLPLEENFFMTDRIKYQFFSVENSTVASNLYTRYVRIEIIEHYNLDFFCPISVFKVFGVSLVDELSGPSLDDDTNSPIYTNLDDFNPTYEESHFIDKLYGFYHVYHIDRLCVRIGEIAIKGYQLLHINSYFIADIIDKILFKSPTLSFIRDVFILISNWILNLLKFSLIHITHDYARFFGIVLEDLNDTLPIESVNVTHIIDIGCHNDSHRTNNSVYTLLTCTFRLLKTSFGRDYCCTVKSAHNENSVTLPDCSVCHLDRNNYGLSIANNIVHSCFLDDFCNYFCQNNVSSRYTSIVPFETHIIETVNMQAYTHNDSILHINNTLKYNGNLENSTKHTENSIHNLSVIEDQNIVDSNTTYEHSEYHNTTAVDPQLNEVNTTRYVEVNSSDSNLGMNTDGNIVDNIGTQSLDRIANNSSTSDSIIKDIRTEIVKPNSTTFPSLNESSTQSSPIENLSNSDTEFSFFKHKDVAQIRDESPLGYISRMKKNLTMTMKYLDEMSIKFRNALDEIRHQILKITDDTNTKISALNRQYGELLIISSIQNATITSLWVELQQIKKEIVDLHGFYFRVSLFDCCLLMFYVCVIILLYKFCRHTAAYLLQFMLKYERPRCFISVIYHMYQKFMNVSSIENFERRLSDDSRNVLNSTSNDLHNKPFTYDNGFITINRPYNIFPTTDITGNMNSFDPMHQSPINNITNNGSYSEYDNLARLYSHYNVIYSPFSHHLCPNCLNLEYSTTLNDLFHNNTYHSRYGYRNDCNSVSAPSSEISTYKHEDKLLESNKKHGVNTTTREKTK